jgi:microcystin-dependent protein
MHPGQGPGLSLHDLGETGGSDTVSLLESEIPSHSHAQMAASVAATKSDPTGNSFARVSGATPFLPPAGAALAQMSDSVIAPAGGDQPHNNMQPYLTLNFCIALQGVFPPRT